MRRNNSFHHLGPIQKKILLLLLGGVGLSLARSPKQYFRVIKGVHEEWQRIKKQTLKKAIKSLYRSRLVSEKDNLDGSTTIVLTDRGKEKALTFNIESMTITRPKRWDGKWRMVVFDIPERRRNARDVFRSVLKQLGFYEFQKSVFVHPYECKNEIDYVIEFFKIRSYVRTVTAMELDNEIHLKDIFELI